MVLKLNSGRGGYGNGYRYGCGRSGIYASSNVRGWIIVGVNKGCARGGGKSAYRIGGRIGGGIPSYTPSAVADDCTLCKFCNVRYNDGEYNKL